jgi:I/LWEQ domain
MIRFFFKVHFLIFSFQVQVKVLELEQALQVERMRLAALRRQNYQSAE